MEPRCSRIRYPLALLAKQMTTYNLRSLTFKESALILILIVVGAIVSWLALDFYDTTLLWAQLIFFLLSLSLSILAFYALLRALHSPAHSRVAGSLWGALPWNSLQVWQLAFLGFFFIPLEIILSGLLVSFRTGLPVWQAMGTSLVVRAAVLLAYYAVRAPIIEFFLGRDLS